jgi:hypothetical protein
LIFRFAAVIPSRKRIARGIGLLAGAAAGHPDPQRLIRRVPVDEIGYPLLRQQLESLQVAEEARNLD